MEFIRSPGGSDGMLAVKDRIGDPAMTEARRDGDDVAAWLGEVDRLVEYHYQPIVSVQSGRCFGYEALVRGTAPLGFGQIPDLFDHANDRQCLPQLDALLRRKAVAGFALIDPGDARLFYNIDIRMFLAEDFVRTCTEDAFADARLRPGTVCLEISELHDISEGARVIDVLRAYRRQAHLLAIDDFGTGYSGLKLLYEQQPNLVKIDRFFVADIPNDDRKKLFVSTAVNLAHVLGIQVVAEGVETEAEFLTCKEIGCDLVQGYFIARPAPPRPLLSQISSVITDSNRRDRRDRRSDQRLIREEIEEVPPLTVGDSMATVFQTFRTNKERIFFPILDEHRRPLGIIREQDLKEFIYSRYGKDLLYNKSLNRGLTDFLTRCPTCEIKVSAEKLLEVYSLAMNPLGIILVEDSRYVGILSAASLLRVINEKNLALARDQNPLTKLPGNNTINDHVNAALDDDIVGWTFAYFDLDNFKPFNDTYGFRQGDRVILLFAELLRTSFATTTNFVGHIGGDDFFLSFRNVDPAFARRQIEDLLVAFKTDVQSFYDPVTRSRGYIVAKDRQGEMRRFPLLTASAGVVSVPVGRRDLVVDDLMTAIAELKKTAKRADSHIATQTLDPFPDRSGRRPAKLHTTGTDAI